MEVLSSLDGSSFLVSLNLSQVLFIRRFALILSDPDLPYRIQNNLELASYDR